jgi:putative copper export protein/mono/diheme cytochrome c family protein
VAGLGLVLYWLRRRTAPHALFSSQAPFAIALLLALAALLTISLTSHAAAVESGTYWALLADGVHLLAISVWVGGLLSIPLLFRASRTIEGTARTRFLASAIARFSPVAALSVVIILGSGIVSSLVEVPSVDALWTTTYGRLLALKLALVLVMLAVGGINAFTVRPRLEQTAAAGVKPKGPPDADRADVWRRRLLATVALEAALGILILGSTSVLSKTPPSRTTVNASAAQPQAGDQGTFEQTVTAADMDVTLTVTPNRTGINQYIVKVAGIDPGEVQRVRLTFLTTDQRFGGSSGVAAPSGGSTWTLEGPYFTFGGPWQVLVDFRRVAKDDVTAQYGLIVAGPLPPKAGPDPSAFGAPEMAIAPNLVAGVYVVIAGLALLLWRRRQRRLGRLSVPALAVSTLAVLGGIALAFGVFTDRQTAAGTGNPIEPTEQSIARGAEIFQQNCAQCHGATGKGDGPLAPTLNPRPVDLTRHVPFHPDEQIFGWISNGLPGTAMPVYKELLSEEDRWHVLNYLRNLTTPQTK